MVSLQAAMALDADITVEDEYIGTVSAEVDEEDDYLENMLRCRVFPISSSGPYIRKVISDVSGELVYDGYFYCERLQFPMQRVIRRRTRVEPVRPGDKKRYVYSMQHVEIYEKLSGEDTSEYSECDGGDDDFGGGGVCFFPTEIVTLRYRVLEDNLTDERSHAIIDAIRQTMPGWRPAVDEPPPTFQEVSPAMELSASDISES